MVQKEQLYLFKRVDTTIEDAVFGLVRIRNCSSSEEWGKVSWFCVYSICYGKLKRMGELLHNQ
jgi:hypothetical protein